MKATGGTNARNDAGVEGLKVPWVLAVALNACLSASCGSSSKVDASVDAGADTTVPESCTPFGAPGCPKGATCCLSGLSGTCTALGACPSASHFDCETHAGCSAGQACCASLPLDAAVGPSTLTPEGGFAALGLHAASFCAQSCPSPSAPICVNQSDCTGETFCTGLPEGNFVLIALGVETLGVCGPTRRRNSFGIGRHGRHRRRSDERRGCVGR